MLLELYFIIFLLLVVKFIVVIKLECWKLFNIFLVGIFYNFIVLFLFLFVKILLFGFIVIECILVVWFDKVFSNLLVFKFYNWIFLFMLLVNILLLKLIVIDKIEFGCLLDREWINLGVNIRLLIMFVCIFGFEFLEILVFSVGVWLLVIIVSWGFEFGGCFVMFFFVFFVFFFVVWGEVLWEIKEIGFWFFVIEFFDIIILVWICWFVL